ncbi:MAG: hypothetical protein GEU82_09475 [Luteitalea sp.]|nr:hypothetical protein [Luteitalea sp.]
MRALIGEMAAHLLALAPLNAELAQLEQLGFVTMPVTPWREFAPDDYRGASRTNTWIRSARDAGIQIDE